MGYICRYTHLKLPVAAVAYQFVGQAGTQATILEQLGQHLHAVEALRALHPALERLASAVVVVEIAYHHIGIVLFGLGIEVLKHGGLYPVVGIYLDGVFTRSLVDACHTGGSHTFVGLVYNLHTGVAGGVFIADILAAIAATVVDQDEFDSLQRLCQQAVDTPAQTALGIVYRYYD